MRLTTAISLLVLLLVNALHATAYPLKRSLIVPPEHHHHHREHHVQESTNASLQLHAVPLSVSQQHLRIMGADTKSAAGIIISRDLATSLATTLIGGGLALILT